MISLSPQADLAAMELPFANRTAAGVALAVGLAPYRDRDDVTVLALPRGGIPVGAAVARALNVPMNVLPVRKIQVAGSLMPVAAIAEGGVEVWNARTTRFPAGHPRAVRAMEKARLELASDAGLAWQAAATRLADRCIIIVDDGSVTGVSMLAAIKAVRARRAGRLIVAVPVAPPETVALLKDACNEFHCLASPEPFHDLSQCYLDFSPVVDARS